MANGAGNFMHLVTFHDDGDQFMTTSKGWKGLFSIWNWSEQTFTNFFTTSLQEIGQNPSRFSLRLRVQSPSGSAKLAEATIR